MGIIGRDHDVVTITLAGETVRIVESYEISLSILQQPSAFSLRLGTGDAVKELKKKYPPGTPFTLEIDGVRQMTGTTDGFVAEGSVGATEFTLRGRDRLRACHDKYVDSERSWADATYHDLTEAVLLATTPGPWTLTGSNAANRKAITRSPGAGRRTKLEGIASRLANGIAIAAFEEQFSQGITADALGAFSQEDVDKASENALAGFHAAAGASVLAGVSGAAGSALLPALLTTAPVTANQKTLQAKVGEKWFSGFLKPELDRAGLMLWCTAAGDFVLSTPGTDGPAIGKLKRRRGGTVNDVNVLRASYRNETTQRYSEAVVHFRSGGGKHSRTRAFGRFVDQEMVDLGFDQKLVVRDDKCKTLAQADFLARKRIAESRRAGWSLEYTVPGHTMQGLEGSRIVLGADVVMAVEDDENDVRDDLYVESVSHRGGPSGKTTTLRLMRKADVVFGEELA